VTITRGGRSSLATDFQSPARKALSHAVALSSLVHAKLVIVHVIKAARPRHASGSDSRYLGALKTAAMLELGRLARVAKEAGLQVETVLQYGSPAASILEEAATALPELIAMGTYGRVGWDRLRLGSTAETIVRESPCPVLTLHDLVTGDLFRHPARVRWRRLLVATDLTSSTPTILRYAVGLAKRLDASLLILHAVENRPQVRAEDHAVGRDGAGRGRRKDGVERLLKRWASAIRVPDLPVESRGVAGPPVETILSEAARWEANLVIVGTAGRRGFPRMVLGSVAEGVIRRAGCPVLVVTAAATRALRKGRERRKRSAGGR
jgi:nucleotide-binding universal stress UspA family protein